MRIIKAIVALTLSVIAIGVLAIAALLVLIPLMLFTMVEYLTETTSRLMED